VNGGWSGDDVRPMGISDTHGVSRHIPVARRRLSKIELGIYLEGKGKDLRRVEESEGGGGKKIWGSGKVLEGLHRFGC